MPSNLWNRDPEWRIDSPAVHAHRGRLQRAGQGGAHPLLYRCHGHLVTRWESNSDNPCRRSVSSPASLPHAVLCSLLWETEGILFLTHGIQVHPYSEKRILCVYIVGFIPYYVVRVDNM